MNAAWQRCGVHTMRNALAHAGKSGRRVVSAFMATAFAQDSAEAAKAQWRKIADQLRPKLPKLAAFSGATSFVSVKARSKHICLGWTKWSAGVRSGAGLWRRLKQQGFRGCLRVVSEWAARRRRADKADAGALARTPSARTIARLLTIGRDRLSKAETITVAAIETGAPMLVEARDVIANFQTMIRTRLPSDLDPWLERASSSLVASFASGVTKDISAIRAAISLPWSNGETEGQITKLKLVKRQMYGRGKLDLLEARVVGLP